MTETTAAMLVIGDEILSGRTRDANAAHLATEMTEMGIALREIRVVPDEPEAIIAAVNALRARVTYVFTSGGIGPTHDDITADCIAAAFGVPIDIRNDARAILEAFYSAEDLNDARLRMARIPEGAELIDNPLSQAPGFILGNVHVMAGVPAIFQVMLEGVKPRLQGGAKMLSHSFRVPVPEGDMAMMLRGLSETHPGVSIGCYPFFRGGMGATVIIRSHQPALLSAAADDLRDRLASLTDEIRETPPGAPQTEGA
ncbi:competence/damage-inducible protein A [Rhodobacteraceae bacterium NNCM2]|nr:competence/damage-inducible protein A [Coraliihabitans acroporae]